jgi:hypothetical protein
LGPPLPDPMPPAAACPVGHADGTSLSCFQKSDGDDQGSVLGQEMGAFWLPRIADRFLILARHSGMAAFAQIRTLGPGLPAAKSGLSHADVQTIHAAALNRDPCDRRRVCFGVAAHGDE